ncbi:SgcJ/EcaC family oxidoreductase [Streptomyces caniscabiei]|uniref:SgcJ/EcaC family oxidoreductase n=1 Tax=Streptomyces caniscabiei TaxID=2746961 RepID=UPI0029ACC398|nr:SgcJ/EcaC family oxidoreductase [Streptomyces caniscabiei]MDX2776044.1 SgcJ/EcaC family oxidoreductase [Streptomyces caniscabiei]
MNILSQSPFTPSKDDIESVCAVVAALEHAQQNELVDAFADLFLPNAVWTTAHGLRLEGADAIREFTAKVLPGAMKHGKATYTPERLFFITPDVVAVNVLQQPITLTGEKSEDAPQGRPLQILYRTSEGWKIAAAQNTQVITN